MSRPAVRLGKARVRTLKFQGRPLLETRRAIAVRRPGGIWQHGTIHTMSPAPDVGSAVGGALSDAIADRVRDIYLAVLRNPLAALAAGASLLLPGIGPVAVSYYLGSRITMAALDSASKAKKV